MPFTYHQAIDKSKIESRLMAIFRAEIETLQALGFEDLYFVREVLSPLSGFLMPLVWLDLRRRKSRDILQVGGLFQIISLNPLLYNHDEASYVHIQSIGITLVTRFQDGPALITVNYPSRSHPNADVNVRFYSIPYTPIDLTWQKHQARIAEMEDEGLQTDDDLSLEKYTAIIQDLYRVAELGVE
jgi:hypothetical protein